MSMIYCRQEWARPSRWRRGDGATGPGAGYRFEMLSIGTQYVICSPGASITMAVGGNWSHAALEQEPPTHVGFTWVLTWTQGIFCCPLCTQELFEFQTAAS